MKRHLLLASAVLAGCTSTPTALTTQAPEMAARDSVQWPAANAQGRIIKTEAPTDLAIQGDGFFVLARSRQPEGVGELIFTRNGAFHFAHVAGAVAGTGTFRLVNQDGLYVMGYQTTVDPMARPFGTTPAESIEQFATRVGDGAGKPALEVKPTAIEFDLVANTGARHEAIAFDERGMLVMDGEPPQDPQGIRLNIHVTLAAFSFAQYLKRLDRETYQYQPAAGRLFLGTAANAQGGDIGSQNVIVPGALERR
jgi:flagellar basal body rod protein FlgG